MTVPASQSVAEIAEDFRRTHEDAILYAYQQMNESDESKKKKNNVHCGCTQAETIFDCQQEWGRTKRSCSPNCHRQNYLGKLIRWTNSALNELFTTWIPTKSFASTARIQILAFSKHY